ncbi:MAG: phosphoribosylaminoimidazolesuccinocarboxamide synthase [Methanomicrobiales archaeon]|nr:phosphoribosylaminoimidazolesuccinocarboxamide synthase [Methanomicrobiales archaeon]
MVRRGELLNRGKAKSVYRSDDPDTLIMEFRDDITAFDGQKTAKLAGKGEYNAGVSSFFFEYLAANGIHTHYIRMSDARTMLVRRLEMVPVEVVVRNIAAGSLVRLYPFQKGDPLVPPVTVLNYKDDARHDPMINDEIAVALGVVQEDELRFMKETARNINRLLTDYLADLGISLVDFKLEFGRRDTEILLGDEISMDSMRLWDARSGESLDKDVYRFDQGDVMQVYAAVARRIAPDKFTGAV